MDYTSLEVELQNRIDAFNKKWNAKCQEEYDGDFEKLSKVSVSSLFEDFGDDLRAIWEISYQMSLIKDNEFK